MVATAGVRFLDVVKPEFPEDAVHALMARIYGITGKLKPLESERDLNFRVSTAEGMQYLLKISNEAEPQENVDFEVAALLHIAKSRPTLPIPLVQPTTAGTYSVVVHAPGGARHWVRLLTFLKGKVLSDMARTEKLVFDQGRIAAEMALAMQGFFHPAAGSRQLLWDVREVGALRPVADGIADTTVRDRMLRVIGQFENDVKPRLSTMRGQIAHMDLTRYNMVVDPKAPEMVAGIIDFGDMHHGPLVQDVAVALADVMQPEADPFAKASAFLRGYQHVLPLQQSEIEILYDLVLVYLVAYYLILVRRGESYAAYDQSGVLAIIDVLQKMGRAQVTELFAQACGRTRPNAVSVGDVNALIARRKSVMGESMYVFYDPPLNMVRGDGVWLYDSAGKRYLDVYNNVPLVGHNHPYVVQAVSRQMGNLNTNTRYICDEIIGYAERITATFPKPLQNAYFVNSGSEANDLAWLMAEAYTGNHGAIIIEDAYHGWTKAVAALSPSGKPGAQLAPHVRTIPAPDRYRSVFETNAQRMIDYARHVDLAIDSLAAAGLKPALCIVDSAYCSNGILEPMPGFLSMVFDKVRAAGGLCVADEVQSGFGRMGQHWWGYQSHAVTPDIVTLGKPMANGYPMGAVITRPDILAAVSQRAAVFATFGGNNVAAVAASAVMDVFEYKNLLKHSFEIGVYLKAGLGALAHKHPLIGDVRGQGAILGVELVKDRQTKTPATQETRRLLQAMCEQGVLLGSDGRCSNVIKLRPPLVFGPEHADLFLDRLDAGLSRL